jgi:hypothetical protein
MRSATAVGLLALFFAVPAAFPQNIFADPPIVILNYQESTSAVVTGDFNRDGKIDLAVTSDFGIVVFLGSGNGNFQLNYTALMNTSPSSLAVGDFNGDGKLDLVAANAVPNTVSVLLGNGDGTFQPNTEYATGNTPSSVAVGDFNGDGKLDLAVATGSGVSILLGNGDGTFQPRVDYGAGNGPCSIAVGDFNGDGRLDIAVANCGGNSLSVLLGNGDGSFQTNVDYPTPGIPQAVVAADFNGDGKFDLAAVGTGVDAEFDPGYLSVFLGNGDGTFPPYVSYQVPCPCLNFLFPSLPSVAVADFDGNGKLGLAVGSSYLYVCGDPSANPCPTDDLNVFKGNGDGTFQYWEYHSLRLHPMSAVAAGDFNGDGLPDVAVASGGEIDIFLNRQPVTLSLQSLPNPSVYGQPVTFTMKVAGAVAGHGTPTGSVSLSSSGYGLSLGTVQLSDGTATLQTTVLRAGSDFVDMQYSGDAKFRQTLLPSGVGTIQTVQDFSVSVATPTPASLTAGHSATASVTLASVEAYAASLSLTCSVSPTPMLVPVCSLSPASLKLSANGSASSTLTINTTAPVAVARPRRWQDLRPLYGLWLPIVCLSLLGMAFSSDRSGRKTLLGFVLGCALFSGLLLQAACGGGSSNTSSDNGAGGPDGTPAGSYTVTVSTKSASITHTTSVTVNVQ